MNSTKRYYEFFTQQQPTLKSASQKLAALFEPADEPGRREFVEAILRYWEEKEVPLKNAPLMGRKTVDLFRLYHIVKDRGGMQEVRLKAAVFFYLVSLINLWREFWSYCV